MTAPSTHRQLASHRHRPARRSAVTFIAETVPRPVRYSFLAALLICSVTHGPHLTQRLMNEDDVGCFTSPAGQSVAVGRWFHGLLRPIHQNITSPVVLGVLSILALAVASAAITWTFDVRSRRVALLTALVVTTTPAIAFSAGYFPGFDSFQGSFMFGALAVLVTVRLKWGFPLGAVFVMLSLASYQAGVNVAVAMAVVVLTRSILLVERSARDILALAGRLLGLGVLGGAMYWLSVRVSLRITGLALADYRGIQNVFDAFGPTEFIRRAKYATKTFISFFYGGYYAIPRLLTYAAILLGVSMVVLIIARAVRKKISPLRTIAALAILTLVPVALNFSGVFQVDDTSYIGSQAFTLAYVFVLVFVEESAIAVRLPFARGAAALLVLIISTHNFIVTENYYVKLESFHHRTTSLMTRIVARIEPLLLESSTVAILGGMPNLLTPTSVEDYSWMKIRDQGLWSQYIGFTPGKPTDSNTWKFWRNASCRHGIQFTLPSGEQLEEAKAAALEMPTWPNEGSVALRNGVIVVNLGRGEVVERGRKGKTYTFEAVFSPDLVEGRDVQYTFILRKNGRYIREISTGDSSKLKIKLRGQAGYQLIATVRLAGAPSQLSQADIFSITLD